MSADRKGGKRQAESSGMHLSYSGGQTSQAIDGADPDSTFNATRESNESAAQKKKKGIFSFYPFKKKTKQEDPKAGISEDSTGGGDLSCYDELKKTAHFQEGLIVQDVPYDNM